MLELLVALLAAIEHANTPRIMARAFAVTLSQHAAISVVVLGDGDRRAIVECVAGEWRTAGAADGVMPIVTGLAVRGPAVPATWVGDPALARVVALALHHLAIVQRVAQLSRVAHASSRELRERLQRSPIVARSAVMRDLVARAHLVAPHPTTVLIVGESGTGKELVAREIHRVSPRARQALVQLNCGAIPETLVESELFGYDRGAFTGAERTHVGAFERAHRGTLLLDEIGELSLAAQVKLLRVLQERAIRRVGGSDMIPVDVRVIAATNRDLRAMVRAGTFREDLFYRLNVFTLAVPALRERRDDVAPLTRALVVELAARLGLDAPAIPRATIAKLESMQWPGNVRELANVLETALILGAGRKLELPDAGAVIEADPDHDQRFDAAMRRAIEGALRASRGKIYGPGGAARQLGLKPQTLQSKMRKLGISRGAFAESLAFERG